MGDADRNVAQAEDMRTLTRLEITVFVEDVVGRQEPLVRAKEDLLVAPQRRVV
jgi:hypothetical protein